MEREDSALNFTNAPVTSAAELPKIWQEHREAQRSKGDLVCSAVGLTVHTRHAHTFATTMPFLPLAAFLALGAAHLLAAVLYLKRHSLYMRHRGLINAAMRLGVLAVPGVVLHAAYRANQWVPDSLGATALAWRVLLTSRAFILMVPATARRTSLAPQVALSLAAFLIASRSNEATCATPLMTHPRVTDFFNGLGQTVQTAQWLLLPSEALPTAGSAVGCCRGVAFLQLAFGVVAPTVLHLWQEAGATLVMAGTCMAQAGWELRLFAALGSARRSHGMPPFVLGSVVLLGCCWALSGALG